LRDPIWMRVKELELWSSSISSKIISRANSNLKTTAKPRN
jgi:hypothetical protein